MNSHEAYGWLIVGFVNDHLRVRSHGESGFCPRCCGVCMAWEQYLSTPAGRVEVETYFSALNLENRTWSWSLDGVIDWDEIERRMSTNPCRNHERS